MSLSFILSPLTYADYAIGWVLLALSMYLFFVPIWAKECDGHALKDMPSYYQWAFIIGTYMCWFSGLYLFMLYSF